MAFGGLALPWIDLRAVVGWLLRRRFSSPSISNVEFVRFLGQIADRLRGLGTHSCAVAAEPSQPRCRVKALDLFRALSRSLPVAHNGLCVFFLLSAWWQCALLWTVSLSMQFGVAPTDPPLKSMAPSFPWRF